MDKLKVVLAALFKYLFTAIVSLAILDVFFKNYFIHVLLISLVITIVNYLFGTILLYKILNYKLASIIVGVVDGIIIYLMSRLIEKFNVNFGVVLFYIVSLAIFEYFYNKYMYSHMA